MNNKLSITKKDLEELRKASKRDMLEVVEKARLDTKVDIKKEIKGLEHYFRYELENVHRKIDRLEERFVEFKDYVYDKLDWLVGAYQKFEQEHDLLTHGQGKLTKRVEKLEQKVQN